MGQSATGVAQWLIFDLWFYFGRHFGLIITLMVLNFNPLSPTPRASSRLLLGTAQIEK